MAKAQWTVFYLPVVSQNMAWITGDKAPQWDTPRS
jgi:hypothetical protein